jgi:hypothetical protein
VPTKDEPPSGRNSLNLNGSFAFPPIGRGDSPADVNRRIIQNRLHSRKGVTLSLGFRLVRLIGYRRSSAAKTLALVNPSRRIAKSAPQMQ